MNRMHKILLLIIFIAAGSSVNSQQIEKWKLSDLKNAVNNSSKPTVLNFWATYCKPCLEEIPYFQNAVSKDSSVELILVSLDLPEMYEKLPAVIKKYGITARVVYLDESNADLFCPVVDESWSGAMPASIFINKKNGYKKFFGDQIKEEAFNTQLKALTGSSN